MNYIQKIWSLSSLVILTFFCGKSNALKMSLSNLTRVCTYYYLFDSENITITPPDDFCTAAASYSEFGDHPPRKNEDITNTTKGILPYVYIYDEKSIDDMVKEVDKDSIQSFIVYIDKLISDNEIDVMLFDFVGSVDPVIKMVNRGSMNLLFVFEYNESFLNDLKSFFDQMKANHKDMLFGLKIHKSAELNLAVFNHTIIDTSIDFYVVNPYDAPHCPYMGHQAEMDLPPTKDEMIESIKELEGIGYQRSKMFLTIEILVKSWKDEGQVAPEDWSYSWLCKADPGGDRKYCRGYLPNYYDQGCVIREQKLPGVFIQAIDCDDFENNCLCGPFAAARSIYDGLTGAPINQTLVNCNTFAILKDDR